MLAQGQGRLGLLGEGLGVFRLDPAADESSLARLALLAGWRVWLAQEGKVPFAICEIRREIRRHGVLGGMLRIAIDTK